MPVNQIRGSGYNNEQKAFIWAKGLQYEKQIQVVVLNCSGENKEKWDLQKRKSQKNFLHVNEELLARLTGIS